MEHRIGGSDIASICGLNPHESSFAAWLRLSGREKHAIDNRFTEWGKRLETAILRKYADTNQVLVKFGPPIEANQSRIRDGWKRGTEDAIACHASDPSHEWGVDAKNSSAHMARNWSDRVPDQYLLQCTWYCHVFELDRWDLAVLIGGNEYRQFRIDRDAQLEQAIVDQVTEWRERFLVRDEQPPAEYDESTKEWISKALPAKRVKADATLEEQIGRFKAAWLFAREADKHLDACKAEIIASMVDAAKADEIESDLGVIKYAKQTRRKVDYEAVLDAIRQAAPDIAIDDLLAQHTTASEIRVFNAPRAWSKE